MSKDQISGAAEALRKKVENFVQCFTYESLKNMPRNSPWGDENSLESNERSFHGLLDSAFFSLDTFRHVGSEFSVPDVERPLAGDKLDTSALTEDLLFIFEWKKMRKSEKRSSNKAETNEEALSQGMTYSLRWAKLEEYVREETVCHILCLAMVLVIDENTNKVDEVSQEYFFWKATDVDEFDKKLKSLPETPKMPRSKQYSDAYKTKVTK